MSVIKAKNCFVRDANRGSCVQVSSDSFWEVIKIQCCHKLINFMCMHVDVIAVRNRYLRALSIKSPTKSTAINYLDYLK